MMEFASQFLTGLGLLGAAAAIALGAALLFIVPIAAIVDCLASSRDGNTKGVLVVFLVLTWSLGGTIYGLFGASTRGLRIFTLLSILVPGIILVASVASCGTGAGMAAQARMERERAEMQALVEAFTPAELSADAVELFTALHFVPAGKTGLLASVARFTLDGIEAATARDVKGGVRQVVRDAAGDRLYAVTKHGFGQIDIDAGAFVEIEVDPSVGEFGWPKGLAFDASRGEVVIATSHVVTRFYRFQPQTSRWERMSQELRDFPLVAMTWSPDDDSLYALTHRPHDLALREIHRFNAEGASLGAIALDPAVPLPKQTQGAIQLQFSSGRLIVVLPPPHVRILAVDPLTGQVASTPHALSPPTAEGVTGQGSRRTVP
jgi:hypothetical protein